MAANRQTIRNSDPVLDLGESARAMTPRPRSCLSTPLIVGKTLVGVMSLYSSNKDAYSEDHERILEVIARQVSGAILEAQSAETQRARSLKDESTGLPNHRHLIEFVGTQLLDEEHQHPLCLITVRFEPGNSTGTDHATEAVITALRQSLRPADLLFRSGEKELVALLLNTERSGAMPIVAKAGSGLELLRSNGVISVSRMGIALAPSDAGEAERLLLIARERAVKSGAAGSTPPGAVH